MPTSSVKARKSCSTLIRISILNVLFPYVVVFPSRQSFGPCRPVGSRCFPYSYRRPGNPSVRSRIACGLPGTRPCPLTVSASPPSPISDRPFPACGPHCSVRVPLFRSPVFDFRFAVVIPGFRFPIARFRSAVRIARFVFRSSGLRSAISAPPLLGLRSPG